MRQAGMEIKYTQPKTEIPLFPGDPERLKQFDVQGYYYSAEQSKPDNLVFLRDHPAE